ncbi:phage portal protein [Kitasatospora sp. NBC_01287]|uniref:phage portal protein n=1 Tax=Kitasatospora sp. NBC_01287 TaxID=2903573 RepID=UPI002259C491|nr:phage portal protein [Kitasatospora sp. NBC_01287]MCX4750910.1 phage portal protein [Kitasatospora sp. NBC_01287]MCX4751869.1 phage portal protein [Kitasatospora sp. NBC_01287]
MPDPRRLTKTFGSGAPAAMTAGENAALMTPSAPFSPGTPISPYDGYSRTPRAHEYVTSYNTSARPRSHERVSFDSLRGLIESYDVAQMCIWHRIDSIRSLDWSLVAAPHFDGDVADAINVGMAALARPDRQTPFSTWLSAYLYDVLAYDAGALYRLRNRRGDAIGLMNVDGTTIAPLLDYWGRSPGGSAEAYVQYINGLPWNWLTRGDLIYEPFRKRPNSPYGLAPLETILLNANTDIRFQVYFLERFTEGNIPQAFASAPESWSPDQIEQWQTLWDSFMAGDQAAKHTIKWMPGGSTIAWSNEKDFTDQFSLFLMRKTAAAFHVVPSDMGFTENVNLSSGESQADVQHRVGDLPLIRHLQHILSAFLQDDLGLPLNFTFDLGEEQADRLQQAQADQIYIQNGVIGASDIRSMRYGLEEPEGIPVPRFIFDARGGPIPLASLYAVAGQIDPATAAPTPGTQLPHTAFAGVEGVMPNPPVLTAPLAEQEYGPSALPPAPPPQPAAPGSAPVAKAGSGQQQREQEAKAELAAFRKFTKSRHRAGRWRDFEFRTIDPVRARRLNQDGRLALRKADGQVAVAGLAVQAADTGRVLMLQRALDPEDPAAGTWEIPGGHLEGDETPLRGAWREWSEETGCIPPPGCQTGSWTSANGVYQGTVWTVDSEDWVPLSSRDQVSNPDDPDGDCIEAIAWWDPAQLAGNPAVRPELLASLPDVLSALGIEPDDAPGELLKAAASPKGSAPDGAWPGWELDLAVAAHWAPLIAAALAGVVTIDRARRLVNGYTAQQSEQPTIDDAIDWLDGQGIDLTDPLVPVLTGLTTDAYLLGAASAQATVSGGDLQTSGWQPGQSGTARDRIEELGLAAGLTAVLAAIPALADKVADTRMKAVAHMLATGPVADIDALAEAVSDAASDPGAVEAVAVTETTRGAATAAADYYQQQKVHEGRWLTEPDGRVCPVCDANAAAGPRPIGTNYPSGDISPPAHPRCRCALVPA